MLLFMERIKTFQPVHSDVIDDLIGMLSIAEPAAETYTRHGLEVPLWLLSQIEASKSKLVFLVRQRKERELRELKMTHAALATPSEKRAALEPKIAALEKELAQV